MVSATKVRQSNIELLRILAIFLVMVGHFNSGMGGGRPHFEGLIDGVVIGRNIVAALASVCVVLFVLISGWFSIKPNLKSIATLWTQILFINLYLFVFQLVLMGGV